MCKAARGQTENQAKQSHSPVDGKSSEPEGKKLSRLTEKEGRRREHWETKIRQGHAAEESHRKNIQETLQNKRRSSKFFILHPCVCPNPQHVGHRQPSQDHSKL